MKKEMQSTLQLRPFTRTDAEEMVSWRYSPPYEIYNLSEPASDSTIDYYLQPALHYYAVLNEQNEMIAFRCFGSDAQVPGGDYSMDALDMGGGLRPDLTGRGLGTHVIGAAMNCAIRMFSPRRFRATIAAFNLRAQKVCESLGYQWTDEFMRPSDHVSFVILVKEAHPKGMPIPAKAN